MRDGPDIARIASLVGDPARASMLTALMDGGALTASELAGEAGVSQATASSHLSKMSDGGLLSLLVQGRHRYFRLSGPQVAAMLESIMGVASSFGPQRTRPGPREPAMREARVCYDHLAGSHAVALLDRLFRDGIVVADGPTTVLGRDGAGFFAARGIDISTLTSSRRPLCRTCIDWSVRRSHLAGALGAAILDHLVAHRWVRREPGSRVVTFSPKGRQAFASAFLG